ncbi:MAG: helix-turn-helix domain-containing protein [Mycolicibacterium sp.]|nr:helix-turn-helix domain-containing protein [Mycolicibacterium sp.]
MLKRVVEISATVRNALEQEIPELRGDAGIIDLLGASVEGNVDTLLHALRHDIPLQRVKAPTAALEYARRLAQRGVPVNALVRAYRLGQRQMTELVFREVEALDIAAAARFVVVEAFTARLFEYIDWISQQVVVVYEDERERWLENQNTMRAARVREVLAGKAVDVDAATNTIRYPLRWHHLAVVMWYPDVGVEGQELARLQRFLRDLGQAADAAAAPLFVAADRTCAWGWLPYRTAAPDVLSKVRRFASKGADAPSVAIGTMAAGVAGFRRSHREAESARAVAMVRGAPQPSVTAATDPGLSVAALLGADVDATREWVAQVLGDLAADNENDARLRDTLRVFLRCGCSYKQAAEELGMHFNTVKYRVGRAITRRGRPVAEDRLDVELALLVCQWYGTAVLATGAG